MTPTTKAGASEPRFSFTDKGIDYIISKLENLSPEDSTGWDSLKDAVQIIKEFRASDAATRAALKDAIKELKTAIIPIGRWNGSTVEQVEHASIPLVKEVISKLSALAGEQEAYRQGGSA